MTRRSFCLNLIASVACAGVGKGVAQCAHALASVSSDVSNGPYSLWSLLIPVLQCECAHDRGYMIAANSAVPDSLPALETGANMSPIQRAMEAARHPQASYQTQVPVEWQPQFAEAVAVAMQHRNETILLERHLILPKHYRLLSPDEIKAFYALSPHAVSSGWRPDPKALREYKGWNAISYLSVPYYDSSSKFAMIWATTGGAGCSMTSWHFFTRTEQGWNREQWHSMEHEECA